MPLTVAMMASSSNKIMWPGGLDAGPRYLTPKRKNMLKTIKRLLGIQHQSAEAANNYTPPSNRIGIVGEEGMDPLMAEAIRQCWETGQVVTATRDESGETIVRGEQDGQETAYP